MEAGGWNIYGMVSNNPIDYWDELGFGKTNFDAKITNDGAEYHSSYVDDDGVTHRVGGYDGHDGSSVRYHGRDYPARPRRRRRPQPPSCPSCKPKTTPDDSPEPDDPADGWRIADADFLPRVLGV